MAAFGDTLTLGGERNLGNTPIMDVRTTAGRYWRAVAYDTFTGRRWLNTGTLIQSIDAANNVITPQFSGREEITHTIPVLAPSGNVLFAASQPLRVSLRAEADLKVIERNAEGDLPLAEIAMLRRAGPPLEMGDTYQVVSSLSDATVEDLQGAGTDYPDWVTDLYLDLPQDMSARVGELAQEITADAETPYDKVVALETYLRGFTYNDQIPAPPPGENAVDYFLFDVKEGYCDYYASSLAMMARSLGIPARVSAGYSQGEYLEQADVYRVREYNAHSWPEVFFPDYGWVEFEPTASEVQIVRKTREDEQPFLAPGATPTLDRLLEEEQFGENPDLGEGDGQLPDTGPSTLPVSGNWWIGLVLMLVVVAVGAVVMLRSGARRSRAEQVRQDPQFTSKLFGKLVQWAQRLKLPLLPSQTPHEQAALLARVAPEGRTAIMSITDLYVEDLFSPYDIDERRAVNAATAWDGLQKLFRREWVRGWFKPLDDMRGRLRRRPASTPEDEHP
ncbi:MAG: transglutaminaseTgpA domain-containing protein [Caldilineales bacterium]